MHVNLAVLADHASVDGEGKLNIMGIFDTIFAPAVPVQHPRMMLVTRFAAKPSELGREQNVVIRLADEDGAQMFELAATITPQPGPYTIPAYDAVMNHILVLQNIVFPKYGSYAFNILIGNNEAQTITLHIFQPPSRVSG